MVEYGILERNGESVYWISDNSESRVPDLSRLDSGMIRWSEMLMGLPYACGLTMSRTDEAMVRILVILWIFWDV